MKKLGGLPKAFSTPSPGKGVKPMPAPTAGKLKAAPALPAVKSVGAVPPVPKAPSGIDALAVQPPAGMPAMKKPKKMGY